MDDTTLSTDQADTLRRLIYQVFDRPCVCHLYDDPRFNKTSNDRRCTRCKLMWDIKGAWPRAFSVAAETWAMTAKTDRK
jgi:hypothetical protein